MNFAKTALLICDLQNDFLHPDGAYARAGLGNARIAGLPAKLAPLAARLREAGGPVVVTQFTLVPSREGAPLISPHLQKLRPFLQEGDFAPGSWGQRTVEALHADFSVEKIAYSAFYMSRLEWLLRRLQVTSLLVCGIVTSGGVTATARDALVRDFDVTILEDACGAFTPDAHDTAIAALRSGCEIADIASVLQRISAFI